jgi:hypothetical protein
MLERQLARIGDLERKRETRTKVVIGALAISLALRDREIGRAFLDALPKMARAQDHEILSAFASEIAAKHDLAVPLIQRAAATEKLNQGTA